MSGGGGGDGDGDTTTTNIPWSGAQPFLLDYMRRASNLSRQPFQPYTGQRISGFSPEQEQGLQMTTERATQGSGVMNAAQGNLQSTLQGDFLNPGTNPAWAPMAQSITDAYQTGTAAQTDAAAARAGAFGSSGYQQQVGMNQKGLGDALAGAAGSLYNNERTNQMRAAMFAPQMAEADYRDAQALLGVGDVRREYQQDLLNQGYQDFFDQQQWPYQQLNVLGNALNPGLQFGSQTSNNGYSPNRTATALGGAASGAAMGSMFGPVGMGVGAAAGGLMGLL